MHRQNFTTVTKVHLLVNSFINRPCAYTSSIYECLRSDERPEANQGALHSLILFDCPFVYACAQLATGPLVETFKLQSLSFFVFFLFLRCTCVLFFYLTNAFDTFMHHKNKLNFISFFFSLLVYCL